MSLPKKEPYSRLDIRVLRTAALSKDEEESILRLFDANYDEANHDYLKKSFSCIRYMSVARHDNELVGFGLADAVAVELPQMSGLQNVILAGICCVHPDYRRQGLFARLEMTAATESGVLQGASRLLACGRMAHPVSFRVINRNPTVIPRPRHKRNDFHRAIGARIAELYQSRFDPDTFVITGDGTPIGYPRIQMDVEAEEWEVFEPVDRDRGDSLLGLAWFPDAPDGW